MARRWRFGTVAVGVLVLAGVGTWSAASSRSSGPTAPERAVGATTTTEPAFATFVAPRTPPAPTTTLPAPTTTTAAPVTTTTTAPVAPAPPDTAKPGTPPAGAASAAAPAAVRRVVMVGDSVMAALSDHYTGAATKIIGGAGWDVVLDAVVNRSALQGETVIRDHLADITDTVVVMLGHNDGSNPALFRERA